MQNEKFDRLLSSIREERVDEETVNRAGERVWRAIGGEAANTAQAVQRLRGCEDFQALIPAYLGKQLAPARVLLFEDHVHACVACRHALERERDGAPQVTWRIQSTRPRFSIWQFAAATAAVAAVTFAVLAFMSGMLPGQHPVRAAVQSVDGSLYTVSGDTVHLVPAGYEIRNGDEVRTAKGSHAVVRLTDGSLVEMGERADLSVSRAWRGTTIRLDGGQVIVQAAKQRTGRLYVATDDTLVSVKGTIFSVNHGIKGSRVAVIEGVVHVDSGDQTADLVAGQEATSSASVAKVPIRSEVAWSKDSARYLALLGDFSVLQKQFAAIPSPGLRYSSDLLPYLPQNTVIYAAIPNLANTLQEAGQMFQDRLQQSPALRNWWKQEQKGNGPRLEDVLDQVKTFTGYLGDEIVVAEGKTGSTYTPPVILARVKQPGLEAFLEQAGKRLVSKSSQPALQVVRDPSNVTPMAGEPLLVYVNNDLLIASPNVAALQSAVARTRQGGTNEFVGTTFYQKISDAYQQGVEWLFCADMEQIFVENVHTPSGSGDVPPGIENVRYLTMEHRDVSGKPESQAKLTFASERTGVASWLAAPAPMGSLEFVSPQASMVTAAAIKNPRSIMEEIFKMAAGGDSNFNQRLAEFEAKTGVNVLDDLAAPLGGEVTLAFDGPLLPTPRWKLIAEVYDPVKLQSTIAKLVDNFNREAESQGHSGRSLQLTQREVGSQTYYTITCNSSASIAASGTSGPGTEINYTFVDSYLIAAPDVTTISHAIQTRQAGYSLTHAPTFQALLPSDDHTNFSAIFYHNLGPVVAPLAEQLRSSGMLTAQQRQSIDALTANSAPGLIYLYGEPNQIVVASNTGFMGFDLGTLMTMGHNGPFLPQMMLGNAVSQSAAPTQ